MGLFNFLEKEKYKLYRSNAFEYPRFADELTVLYIQVSFQP